MSFHLSVSDNMAAFRGWHAEAHPNTSWAACPYPPCDRMEPVFRACWKDNR